MIKRRRWLIVVAAILVLVLAHPLYAPFIISAGDDYLSISELSSQAEFLANQPVRVGGRVVPSSVDWDDKERVMRFALTDDSESLDIVYSGIVPDGFGPGVELVVAGIYRPNDDVFETSVISGQASFCNTCH